MGEVKRAGARSRAPQAKWFAYERRAEGLTDEEKIVLAREVLAMPPFGLFQSLAEHHWEAERYPKRTELDLLIEELEKEPVRLLSFRRRSLGMKSEREKVEVAKAALEMPVDRVRAKN